MLDDNKGDLNVEIVEMSIHNYISNALLNAEFSNVESHKTHSVCAVILCLYLVCLHL